MPPTLSMPLFVNPQDVILRMQLSTDLTGIDDVISSGIIAAQLHVERAIDGYLQRRSQNCLFYTDAQSFSGITPGGLHRLEVPSGLVREDEPQTVSSSTSNMSGPFTSYESINPELMRFDYKKGYLYVDAMNYGDSYIRVQCTTGFEDGTRPLPIDGLPPWSDTVTFAVGDQVAYNGAAYTNIAVTPMGTPPTNATYWSPAFVPMEQIPAAIYEAIMSLVPMVFNAQQTTNRSEDAKSQYQTLTDHANLLLQPYMRTSGFTFRAL